MVAYEFYSHDPIRGYQFIGKCPERRRHPARITRQSVINWGKKILGKNIDGNDTFLIEIKIDENTEGIQPNSVYKPLKEFLKKEKLSYLFPKSRQR